jgi:hypothetical protein
VGDVVALALGFVLYPQSGLGQKNLTWAGLGIGAFIALLALWLMVLAVSGNAGMGGFGFQINVGSGAIVNLLAGAAVAGGGFLKAREEIFHASLFAWKAADTPEIVALMEARRLRLCQLVPGRLQPPHDAVETT